MVPQGFTYREDLVTAGEEEELLGFLQRMELRKFVMRGQAARRAVRSFGWSYDFDARSLRKVDPIPGELIDLREIAASLGDVPAAGYDHALVTRYPEGAAIGWHRDAPPFGPTIIGVSLASACRMRFRRELEGVRYVYDQLLEPRSAYALSGLARSAWEHSIPPTTELRYSVTFRTVRSTALPSS